ncbi:formimidoylglutamase [Robertmurraya sp. GLU-23]
MSFEYVTFGKEAVFRDRHVTKVSETIVPFSKGEKGEIGIIGLPLSKTSISLSQAAEAPQKIRSHFKSFTTYSGETDKDHHDMKILDYGDCLTHPTDLTESIERIYQSVSDMLKEKSCERYVILGGDHGVSFPSIRAFSENLGRIGVIQWDAHHDVRNFEDSGRTNGTPFRSLIESGYLKGDDLVQIGIRDFSNSKVYREYTREKGIQVYTMGDIEKIGLAAILINELTRLEKEVDYLYLSVDMDVVDQAFAPGCPAIGPGGFTSRELLSSIEIASAHPKVKAMDIVEVDPSKDVREMTSRLAAFSMLKFMYSKRETFE